MPSIGVADHVDSAWLSYEVWKWDVTGWTTTVADVQTNWPVALEIQTEHTTNQPKNNQGTEGVKIFWDMTDKLPDRRKIHQARTIKNDKRLQQFAWV